MLLEAGRDTGAMLFLDTRLGALREAYLQRVLDGDLPEDDYWERGETAVVEEVKRHFYAPHVQEAVKAEKGYEDHSQKLVEKGIWLAHERLKNIPFVGDPQYLEG